MLAGRPAKAWIIGTLAASLVAQQSWLRHQQADELHSVVIAFAPATGCRRERARRGQKCKKFTCDAQANFSTKIALTLSIGDLQEGEEEQEEEEEDGEGEEKSDRTMATATITKSKQSGPPSKPRRACVSWLV